MKKETGYVLGCYILWGLFPLYWNLLQAVDSFCVLGWRGVSSLAVVVGIFLWNRDWVAMKAVLAQKALVARLCLAGVLMFANWGMYIWAVNHGHRLDASLAYYMTPLLSVVIGLAFFGERLLRHQAVALSITVLGVIWALVESGEMPWLSLILGGTFALYSGVKKPVKLTPNLSLFVETVAVLPLCLGLILWAQSQGLNPAPSDLGWRYSLLLAGGVVSVVPLFLFAKGIQKTSLTLVGMLMYINPTIQMCISVLSGDDFTRRDAILFGGVWLGLAVFVAPDVLALLGKKETNICVSSQELPVDGG